MPANGEEKAPSAGDSLKRGTSFKAQSTKEKKDSTAENSILKKESSYLNNNAGQSRRATQAKGLTFADDHGDALTEENFVNQLHYPQNKAGARGGQKGCCTIS
jgi:hypothetical protein